MVTITDCPNDVLLARGARGELSPEEAERLALHLEQCSACAQRMDSVAGENQLGQALRAGQQLAAPVEDAQIVAVMDNLLRLPGAADSGATQQFPEASRETPQAAAEDAAEDLRGLLGPAQQPDELGRLGPYRVLQMLGQGGMGLVFQAEDVRLKRCVALKVMRPRLAQKKEARERFLREGQAAAAIEHDNIVAIHEVGEENGMPFLAMPWLKGVSLESRLQKGGGLSIPQVLRLGRQIALGLAAAHERGLIHRDIKPANLWIEPEQGGRIKILDFGLARPVASDASLTQTGTTLGTPAYMSPEQARGQKVDHRCDLFSLGCVLYRMCTGQPAFKGENTAAVLMSLALDEPIPPHALNPDVPAALSDLVLALLAKDPARRPDSGAAKWPAACMTWNSK